LLEPLCRQGDEVSTADLRSSVARIYLQSGNLPAASKHFAIVDNDPATDQSLKDMNAALLASAEGDWTRANTILRTVLERDAENLVVRF
jgi:trafficking protein particle complex subunit 12